MNIRVNLLIAFLILACSFSLAFKSKTNDYTVYFFLLDECKICAEYAPEITQMHKKYKSDNIDFIGLFPNFSSKPAAIKQFKKDNDIQFELKTDYFKKMTNRFDVSVLPEVIVYDNVSERVVYKGRIDNRYVSIGKRRRVISEHELLDVLEALSLNRIPEVEHTKAIGCFVNFNDNLKGK